MEKALDAAEQGTPTEIVIRSVNWCEVFTKLQRGPASRLRFYPGSNRWTTDKAWIRAKAGVPIEVLR